MVEVKVPICHLTIGPGAAGVTATLVRRCIGSECSMWVPQVEVNNVCGVSPICADGSEEATYESEECVPTGLGWCGVNLRANPFPDPAKEGAAGGFERQA